MLPEGLFAILDPNHTDQDTAAVIEALLDAEAVPFIVRNKSATPAAFEKWVCEIDALRDVLDFDYIINHDVSLAQRTKAIGVHLTAKSMSVSEARGLLGPHKLIGYSAHSIAEALTAKLAGADYVFLGAIFETPKANPDHPILGTKALYEASKRLEIPVYAIGGINEGNLLAIKDAGAAGFSALRAVYENGEIEHNITKLAFLWEDL